MSTLAMQQLREKIVEVTWPGEARDDLNQIAKWIEESFECYRKMEKILKNDLKWWKKNSIETEERCRILQEQVEELEAEIQEDARNT